MFNKKNLMDELIPLFGEFMQKLQENGVIPEVPEEEFTAVVLISYPTPEKGESSRGLISFCNGSQNDLLTILSECYDEILNI